MNQTDVRSILSKFPQQRILVLGDLMLDAHVWGQVKRVSPEAPVLVVEASEETYAPGGAANAAAQIAAFGAEVIVAGVIGKDSNGEILTQELERYGIQTDGIITLENRPTTCKTRILAGNAKHAQHVVRVDKEDRSPLPDEATRRLIKQTLEILPSCHALLLSDYIKGVLGRKTVQALTEAAEKQGIPITANPKPTSIAFYKGVTVAQLNRVEAQEASKHHLPFLEMDDTRFHEAGRRLREQLGVRNLLITRSEKGLTLFLESEEWLDIAAHSINVEDVAGAGDSTIAGLTLALATGATLEEAVRIGNASGAAVVQKVGVDTASCEEIAYLLSTLGN
jgi:rfaE bifunctional protein kinase chain/domain